MANAEGAPNSTEVDREWTRRRLVAVVTGWGGVAPFFRGRRSHDSSQITLRYTSHVPRSHGLFGKAFVPFASLVENETAGRIRLEPFMDPTGFTLGNRHSS